MGSSMQEQFALTWKDFHSKIATSFKDLRDEDEFLDVTLACDEDKQIQAHKVILSACSPYFKSMLLKQRSAIHPVLIMPDSVRFEDIVSLIDFMYHGEVAVPTDDLNIFLNTAKQFKVKGLAEEDGGPPPRMRNVNRPTFTGMKPRPNPMQSPASVPPDIRQRLPPGIQMVKRPSYEPSPEKRPRLHPPPRPMHHNQPQYVEEDEEDDITEIREGDDSNEFYDDYGNEYDDSNMGYDDDGAVHPQQNAPGNAPQMVGLLCPNCRTMCKGVPALQEHMKVCKGAGGNRGGQQQGPPAREAVEEPQECHICDKSFKSHRTLDNHMKKQHGLAAPPKSLNVKGRGRPKKSPAAASVNDGGWHGGDGGYEEVGVAQPLQRGRPVGQVAPVRVGDNQPPSRAQNQPSTSAAGDTSRGHMSSTQGRGGKGRGMPPARGPTGRKPGQGMVEGKPNLQQLGMKFGGQISITSSNQAPGGKKQMGGQDGGQGVSVMKMKGDVQVGDAVSIKDATSTKGNSKANSVSGGESSKADSNNQESPIVKEEPRDDVDNEVAEENFDDYGDGDYADGNEDDYVGPGAEYLDDPDFTGEDVEADGMDVDLYSQYKNRGEGDFEEDEAPLDDEYEEEA